MAPYSMDLRTRVVRDGDAGMSCGYSFRILAGSIRPTR